jgi:hypothetical protein
MKCVATTCTPGEYRLDPASLKNGHYFKVQQCVTIHTPCNVSDSMKTMWSGVDQCNAPPIETTTCPPTPVAADVAKR